MAKKSTITVKILESKAEIKKRAVKAIDTVLFRAAKGSAKPMQEQLRKVIGEAIKNSMTYQSIVSGQLKFELGIPDGASKLNTIVSEWVNSIVVDVVSSKSKPRFLIRVVGINSSYADVLVLPEATQDTEKGQSLEWLRWLLLEGSNIIIMDFELSTGRGRAGPNIMVKRTSGVWRVPDRFQGVMNDNFVTRAIDDSETIIKNIITQNFIKKVK